MNKGDLIQVLLLAVAFLVLVALIVLYIYFAIWIAIISTLITIVGVYVLSRFIK